MTNNTSDMNRTHAIPIHNNGWSYCITLTPHMMAPEDPSRYTEQALEFAIPTMCLPRMIRNA